ncbi:MAG: hypothetical protein ACR2PT_05680 [Endozoicomonas sp.]
MKRVLCLFLGAMLFSAMTFSFDHALSFKIIVGPGNGQITVVFNSGLAYRLVEPSELLNLDRSTYRIEFGSIRPNRRFHQLGELLVITPAESSSINHRITYFEVAPERLSGYCQILNDQRGFLQESGLAEMLTWEWLLQYIGTCNDGTLGLRIATDREAQVQEMPICRVERAQISRNSGLFTGSAILYLGREILMLNPQFILLLNSMMQQFSQPLANEPIELRFQYVMMTMFLLGEQSGFPDILQAFTVSSGPVSDSWQFISIQNNEIGSHQVQLNPVDFNEVNFNQYFPPQLTQQHIPAGAYFFSAVEPAAQLTPAQHIRHYIDERRRGAAVLVAFLTLLCAALLGYYGAY